MAEGIISRFCMALLRLTPVLFVSAVIIWSYYAYAVHMCIFTVKNVPEKVIYLVFYHPFLLMMVWCFLKTICSEPAAVPTQYYLSESDLEKFENLSPPEQKQFLEQRAIKLSVQCRTNAGAVRFCVGCRCIKPDRAHHCSVCQKCILKMDHHCPWVNNCICFSSYKFFVLLISYSLLYCLFVSATSFQYFIKFWLNVYGGDVEVSNLNNVFLFFAGIVFVLSLTGLLCYHSSLIARNRTTLEAFRAPIFRSGPDRNGFNLGTYANFMEVFGNRKLLWFLPVFTALGDGAKFTTRIAPASVGYQSMGTSSIGLEPYINLQTTPVMIQPAPKFNETSYGGGTDDDMNSPEENYRNPSDPYHVTPVQHKRM